MASLADLTMSLVSLYLALLLKEPIMPTPRLRSMPMTTSTMAISIRVNPLWGLVIGDWGLGIEESSVVNLLSFILKYATAVQGYF